MALRSSTEWPSSPRLQDTPSALQLRMTWVQGRHTRWCSIIACMAPSLVVRFYVTVSSIHCRHLCVHVCLSLCFSCLSLPFSPALCLSLSSPASSVKWWTCSPHAVCHCHPSLQSWRWQGWPGCVWSGRGPLALPRRMTSTMFWRWRRKARYVSHSFFFLNRNVCLSEMDRVFNVIFKTNCEMLQTS